MTHVLEGPNEQIVAEAELLSAVLRGGREEAQAVVVDVETSVKIDVARAQVAAFASDPENAPLPYVTTSSVVWQTPLPATVGSRHTFVALFLERRIAYTYEVREVVQSARFVMSTSEGPFPMRTTYTWADTPSGEIRMTMRNQGEPSGFGQLAASVMAAAIRRANPPRRHHAVRDILYVLVWTGAGSGSTVAG